MGYDRLNGYTKKRITHSDVLGRSLRAEENSNKAEKDTADGLDCILLCLVAVLFCSQASAHMLVITYSPYYGYPAAYGYAGYGWGYPGYASWWGSNKGGKGPEGPAEPNGPSGLTGNQ
ncbi:hypothetical protein PRIPAC_91613 [Pristionchus pacificus]|uniref:Uncharacterized protein n=1 Tax=Pristionchus pacificus TaxID=54126 RepID=A0A2A6BRJ2_PRIPA|nr:hypothetical protein PRIPAC_91613 [Pristionchus pacificus]|eukprot:PDM68413.1 hypothetical protein PRIPAC_46457 [Pristionchus pacificus]